METLAIGRFQRCNFGSTSCVRKNRSFWVKYILRRRLTSLKIADHGFSILEVIFRFPRSSIFVTTRPNHLIFICSAILSLANNFLKTINEVWFTWPVTQPSITRLSSVKLKIFRGHFWKKNLKNQFLICIFCPTPTILAKFIIMVILGTFLWIPKFTLYMNFVKFYR